MLLGVILTCCQGSTVQFIDFAPKKLKPQSAYFTPHRVKFFYFSFDITLFPSVGRLTCFIKNKRWWNDCTVSCLFSTIIDTRATVAAGKEQCPFLQETRREIIFNAWGKESVKNLTFVCPQISEARTSNIKFVHHCVLQCSHLAFYPLCNAFLPHNIIFYI